MYLDAKKYCYFHYSTLTSLVKFKYFLSQEIIKIVDMSGSGKHMFSFIYLIYRYEYILPFLSQLHEHTHPQDTYKQNTHKYIYRN